MMSTEYTPTTEEVRAIFITRAGRPPAPHPVFSEEELEEEAREDLGWSEAFDRWLASVKAEAAEAAIEALGLTKERQGPRFYKDSFSERLVTPWKSIND